MPLLSTREVAKLLKIPESRLQDLLRRGKVPEPQRAGASRAWAPKDVEAARVALERNR